MQNNICENPFSISPGQYKIYLGKHTGYDVFMYDVSDDFFTINNTPTQGITATALSNASGTIATITNGGSGYVTAPIVTVTGGVCSNHPVASATISTSGVVTNIILTGAVNCTTAPILIVAPPFPPIPQKC